MGKYSKNILIAAIAYVAVLVFDNLCTFVPSIGQPIQEWAGFTISFVGDILIAWVFIELLRHESKRSITRDASIMGLVSVVLLVLDLVGNLLTYIFVIEADDFDNQMETYYLLHKLRLCFLYVPGTILMIVSVLRLSIAHGRNLLMSIGGWLYGITFSLYLIFYIFEFIYVAFPRSEENLFWYYDIRIYIILAGNIGTALFLFGLAIKDLQKCQTRVAHTPALSYIFYYAGIVAFSFGSFFLLQELLEEKISWLVDYKTSLYSALALAALSAVLILIGVTLVKAAQSKEVLKKFPTSSSNETSTGAFIFAGILLIIGIILLFIDSRDKTFEYIYAFSSFALAVGLTLIGIIGNQNVKIRQHLSHSSRSTTTNIFYILGYLCMAVFLVFALVDIGNWNWHDFAWYTFGIHGAAGLAVGLALVGAGYLYQYNCNIKTLDTLMPEQKESPEQTIK